MSVFLDPASLAELKDYTGLVASATRWLKRDFGTADVPDFIRLAEARFRRLIVAPEMETTLSITPSDTLPLPADFDSAILLYIPHNPRRTIAQVSMGEFAARPNDTGGQPQIYTISSGSFLFSPTPDATYPANLIYRATIPTLGPSLSTNWLLDRHPDIYLYGTLTQAEFFGWNDERLPLIRVALDEAIDELNRATQRKKYGGPLQMQSPVTENVVGSRYVFKW